MPVRLALSLHAPDDALRSEIMPVNERYPLRDVLAACERWYERRRRMVFIEYVMLAGVNDRYEQALALAKLLDRAALQDQPDPVQPDGLGLRRLLTRGDRRLPRRAREARLRRDRAPDPRPATSTPPAGSWRRRRSRAERVAPGHDGAHRVVVQIEGSG